MKVNTVTYRQCCTVVDFDIMNTNVGTNLVDSCTYCTPLRDEYILLLVFRCRLCTQN